MSSGTAPAPRWSQPVRIIHAISALVVILALAGGLAMNHLISDAGTRFEVYQLHKSVGFTVLVLTVLRIVSRGVFQLRSGSPPPVGALWQRRLATWVQAGFYLALLAMPVLGWAMVSASPIRIPTQIFGLFTLPPLLPPDLVLYGWLKTLHRALGWLLGVLLLLHVAGTLWHWREGVMGRMWRLGR
jgi:cytochrome b561